MMMMTFFEQQMIQNNLLISQVKSYHIAHHIKLLNIYAFLYSLQEHLFSIFFSLSVELLNNVLLISVMLQVNIHHTTFSLYLYFFSLLCKEAGMLTNPKKIFLKYQSSCTICSFAYQLSIIFIIIRCKKIRIISVQLGNV